MHVLRRMLPLLAIFLLVGCEETPTVPGLSPDAAALSRGQADARVIRHVHRAPHAPPFKDEVASATFVPGQAGQVQLNFSDGTPFALLDLGSESLVGATIDGVPVADGQPVTITLSRVDASRFMVDMQPSGLEFNTADPARLTFFYDHAEISGPLIEVVKQHNNGESWHRTEFHDDRSHRRMRARVNDFTRYAMAYPS